MNGNFGSGGGSGSGFGGNGGNGYGARGPGGMMGPSMFGPPVTARPALTAIPGGAGTPQAQHQSHTVLADPEAPPELRSFLVRAHLQGKRIAKDVVLPWVALQLSDTGPEGGVIHEEPYLAPDLDDDELVDRVWERCKARIRMYDDALPHHFLVVVWFANEEGNRASESLDLGPILLPRTHGEWGSQPGMQQRGAFGMGGGGSLGFGGMGGRNGHPAPHLAMQEIEAAALHHAGIREVFGMFGQFMRATETRLARHEDREIQVMELYRDLCQDQKRQDREQKEWDIKMALLQGAFTKCLPMLEYGGLQFIDVMKKRLDKRPPKTPREMQAFGVIKKLVTGATANGMSDPEQLWAMLKGMMGGKEDPELRSALEDLLMEIHIDGQREKADASMRAGRVVAGLLGEDTGEKK